jgi:hypothetical protein
MLKFVSSIFKSNVIRWIIILVLVINWFIIDNCNAQCDKVVLQGRLTNFYKSDIPSDFQCYLTVSVDKVLIGNNLIDVSGKRLEPGYILNTGWSCPTLPPLQIGDCVELSGGWCNGDSPPIYRKYNYYVKKITCPDGPGPTPQCPPGPIGSTQCSGNVVRQQYQDANCNRYWQTIDDCNLYIPSKCCTNGACQKCGEQETYRCVNNVVQRLVVNNGVEEWQVFDDCNRYNPPRRCIGGVCIKTDDPTPGDECNQAECQAQSIDLGQYTKDGKTYNRYRECNCVDLECKCELVEKVVLEQEIMFTGTARKFQNGKMPGAPDYWTITADIPVISGPLPCSEQIDIITYQSINDVRGYVDPNIKEGDQVEVYGKYRPQNYGTCDVTIYGSNKYYINKCYKEWWTTEDGIASLAEKQKVIFGAEDYDYYETNQYILIVLFTGNIKYEPLPVGMNYPLREVDLIIFDKLSKEFKNHQGLGIDLYYRYFLKEHRDDLANSIMGYVSSPQQNILDLQEFAKKTSNFWGLPPEVLRVGTVIASCYSSLGAACVLTAAIQFTDYLTTAEGVKIKEEDIIKSVRERSSDIVGVERELYESMIQTEKGLIALKNLIIADKLAVQGVESLQILMAKKSADLVFLKNIVGDVGKDQMKMSTRVAAGTAADTLVKSVLTIFVSASSVETTQKLAIDSGNNADAANLKLNEIKEQVNKFKGNPTKENYEAIHENMLDSYDAIAISYLMKKASLQSAKDSPAGLISGFLYWLETIIFKGVSIQQQIDDCADLALDMLTKRMYYATECINLPLYLPQSINQIIIPDIMC